MDRQSFRQAQGRLLRPGAFGRNLLLWLTCLVFAANLQHMAAAAPALQAPLVIRHYSSTEGLPVSSASNAAIDAEGFLWLATHDGLARFDGRAFTVYDAARFREMGGNRVLRVFADARGQIYALGSGGEWLRVSSQQIHREQPDPEQPDAKVRFVQPEPLCLTLPRGLYCADAQGMRLRRRFEAGWNIRMAVADGDSDWLLAQGQGVLRCHGATCRTLWSAPELNLGADVVVEGFVDRNRLLLGLPSGLLEVAAEGPGRWLTRAGARTFDLLQLRAEPDGSVMAGTGGGLFRIFEHQWQLAWPGSAVPDQLTQSWRAPDGGFWHSEDGRLYRDRKRVLDSRGVVTSVLFAADGTAFVTTRRDGLYVLAMPRVELVATDPALGSGNLYGLAAADDGSVWVGSLGGGLLHLQADGRSRGYARNEGLPGDNIWAVSVAPDQRVYAASYQPGMWQLAPGDTRFQRLNAPAALDSAQIRAFSFDADGQLWVGGTAGAWVRSTEGWQQRWPIGANAMVLAIAHQPDGTVWYGSEQGLWRQDARQSWSVAPQLLEGVGVRGLFLASDGAIWACSEGRGLLRVAADDPHGLRAIRLGRAEGLPSNSPHAIVEDRQGDLWVNSNQGIFRISRTDLGEFIDGRRRVLSPLTLGLADGLTELEGNGGVQPAALLDRAGRVWFPSQRGVVRFDPQQLPLRRQPPKAVIDGIDSEGQPLHLAAGRVLDPGRRSIQVRYNAAELHGAGEVRFRYRLQPSEVHWTEAGTRQVAAFAALLPGKYRFEVVAGNSDGFWATQPAVISFEVPAYWYETRWAGLGVLALGFLIAVVLAQWRLNRLRQRATQLDAEVRSRTAELSEEKQRVETTLTELAKAHGELALTHEEIEIRNRKLADQASRLEALDRFRSRLLADVSHELRTPLMLIKLPLQDLLERSTELAGQDRERLDLPLKQTERLGHLVEQLVGLVQAEAGQLSVHMQRVDLHSWAQRLLAAFQPIADRQQIRLQLQCSGEVPAVYADRDHLTTILSNLLDNALKHAPAASEVRVEISAEEDTERARVSVLDSGAGFAPELADSLFERFFRVAGPPRHGREGLGIGLALARELVELHGGRIGAQALVGVGSRFWFELPLGSAHVSLEEIVLAPAEPVPAMLPTTGTGGILLVEDHPELAAYLRDRLAESFPVEAVADAETALIRLQRGDIRVLISDVMLPGMDGVELCRRVKSAEFGQSLPVILISAKAAHADRQQGLAAGALAWLNKPFAFAELLSEIQRHWPLRPESAMAAPTAGKPHSVDAGADADAILQIARQHMATAEFGVAQWAQRVHLSDRQLRRRVTELTGLSPIVWLRETRLREVHQLISSGRCRTLADAGLQVGLTNPSYLYRLYRSQFGEG